MKLKNRKYDDLALITHDVNNSVNPSISEFSVESGNAPVLLLSPFLIVWLGFQ